jgi:shikimate kinase
MATFGHLFLTGFMGAGKTVVGRSLANLLHWSFVDLDERIEQVTGQTIPEIFANRSEEGFRELESATLRSLELEVPTVVATGGGVPLRSANQSWMRQHGTTVWLDAPFELIQARLQRQASGARPLFDDLDRAHDLYEKRRERYGDADLHIEVLSSDSVVTVAARVRDRLVEQGCVT